MKVDEAPSQINMHAHIHFHIIADSIEDARLLLNMTNNIQNNILITQKNNSPCESIIRNYKKLYVTNDSKITLGYMSSDRLKSLGRIICSESEWKLYTHMLMNMSCQFRV